MVKNHPAKQETWVQALGQEDPLEKGMATHSSILNMGWRGGYSESGHSTSGSGAQQTTKLMMAQQVKNLRAVQIQEVRVQFLSQEHFVEKEMATHSSILAWSIPWAEEPGGLQSMGSQRVGYD